ncbi:AfsR/SARP family transcriptional regulator [Planomonospora alba]|uniref:AfsR/SARP family transcriptional regulator n=1 Tax=Planomonospora alba TaxID=161354 RepID=UPI0031F095FB
MNFSILGPLEIRRADRTVEIAGRRLRALLCLLLLDAGRAVPADRLVAGVWGDDPPAAVGNALQALVSRLRTVLREDRALVEATATGYRLAADPDRVDAHRFARLAAEGRSALAAGSPADAADTIRAALALWRGAALSDLGGNGIVAAQVARLDALRLAALEDRVEADLLLGRQSDLIAELPALIAAHPLRERLRGQLMRALYGAGRRVEALAAFEEARALFAEELGADPSPELTGLHLSMLRGDPPSGTRPGPRAPAGTREPPAAPRPGSLPARLTSFVGREHDVARASELLADHRLVTLLGPGGAGKTRLAVETAEAVAGRMPDGVRLVELAPVGEPDEVPQAVFSALGLRDGSIPPPGVLPPPVRDPVSRLLAVLSGKRVLIVLDNCEHVVEAAAALAGRPLPGCPGVRILATSREPLGITGELTWPVPPLGLPPEGGGPHGALDAEAALRSPAVRLFAERAAAVRPGYRPEAEIEAVVRVCRELDGMPLAIELAAARLRSLSAGQLADRLDDRFRLLTGGSRTALPRHRTLRAVVEWSWDLLDGPERTLARRLSVFSGGVSLEAAERVCSGEGLPRGDVLDVLARLVDKSLVTVAARDGAVPRYRMLETIRAYAAERLAAAGEEERFRLAHAEFFAELAESADPGLRDRRQAACLAEMSREHDNLSAALRWTTEAGRAGLAFRLVGAMGWYWWLRGHRAEAAHRAREVLRLADGAGPGQLALVRAVHGASAVGTGIGLDVARAELAEAARLARQEVEPPWHPLVVLAGPIAEMFTGVHPDGGHLDGMSAHPDPWVRALARMFRGSEHLAAGRTDAAEAELRGCLRGFEELGECWGTGNAMGVLAELDFMRGEPEKGLERLRGAVAVLERIDAVDEIAYMRGRVAFALNLLGDRATARRMLDESLRTALRSGDRVGGVAFLTARGDFARESGDLAEARGYYADALRMVDAEAAMPVQIRALVNVSLSMLAEQEGDLARARRLLGTALEQAAGSADAAAFGVVLIGLAGLSLAEGDPARAAALLGGAATARGADAVVDFDHVRITGGARSALGEEEFARHYGRGRALSRTDLLSLAGRGTAGGGPADQSSSPSAR